MEREMEAVAERERRHREYPDHAARITARDVAVVVEAYVARGAQRQRKSERQLKWDAMAVLVEKAGLGRLKDRSVEQIWQKRDRSPMPRVVWSVLATEWEEIVGPQATRDGPV